MGIFLFNCKKQRRGFKDSTSDNICVTYIFSDREKYGRNLLRCGSFILFY